MEHIYWLEANEREMKELIERLVIGDSVMVLPMLIDRNETESCDLCITSPPYWRLVKYEAGEGDLSLARTEKEFEDKLTQILKYIWRLLKKDGTLALQWEDMTIERPDGYTGEYMLCTINHAAEKAGFILYTRYIWKKFTKKPTVQYSSYDMAKTRLGRPNPNWTYLFIYKKNYDTKMSTRETEITREEWNKWSDAVWEIPNPGVRHHETPFAPEIVDRILKIYTARGDKIIDPFLGSGTTMRQCILNNRSCTGIELDKRYIKEIKNYVGWGQQTFEYKMIYKYEEV